MSTWRKTVMVELQNMELSWGEPKAAARDRTLWRNIAVALALYSISTTVCKSLIHGLVTSRLDYGNTILYGISDRHMHRLEMVQRSAARIVRQIRRGDRQSTTTILRQLHWLPVRKRIDFKLLVLAQGHIQWHAGVSCGTATPPHTSPFAALCRRVTARGAQSQPGTFRPPCICLCRTHSVEQTSKEHT